MNKKGFLDDFFPYLAVGAFVVLFAVILLMYGATQSAGQGKTAEKDLLELQASTALHDYLTSNFNGKPVMVYITIVTEHDKLFPEWKAFTSSYFQSHFSQNKFSLRIPTVPGEEIVINEIPRLPARSVAYLPSEVYGVVELSLYMGAS